MQTIKDFVSLKFRNIQIFLFLLAFVSFHFLVLRVFFSGFDHTRPDGTTCSVPDLGHRCSWPRAGWHLLHAGIGLDGRLVFQDHHCMNNHFLHFRRVFPASYSPSYPPLPRALLSPPLSYLFPRIPLSFDSKMSESDSQPYSSVFGMVHQPRRHEEIMKTWGKSRPTTWFSSLWTIAYKCAIWADIHKPFGSNEAKAFLPFQTPESRTSALTTFLGL